MFARYRNQSIAQQIVQVACILLLIIFAAMTIVVTQLAELSALRNTEQSLTAQVNSMKSQLDAYFENVNERGERSSNMCRKYLPGDIAVGSGTIQTGGGRGGGSRKSGRAGKKPVAVCCCI